MVGVLLTVVLVGAGIVLAGLTIGNAVSSPQTRALTRLVSAHRLQGALAQAESVGGIFSLYGLDASGRRDAQAREVTERRRKLLQDAAEFDRRYGKFHWGVKAQEILERELGKRLDEL
ncbi:MAG: hypothetical protein AAGD13_14335 [Pseudomonadota bacterium]